MCLLDKDELRRLAGKSTQVNQWLAHRGGDCYGLGATVRGPFFRWFRVEDRFPSSKCGIADDYDDAAFAAASMNAVIPLLNENEALKKENAELRARLQKYEITGQTP